MSAAPQHDTDEYRPLGGPEHPIPPAVRVDVAALSHPGLCRRNNEDVYLVVRAGRYLETLETNLPHGQAPVRDVVDGHALLVADGVGGSAAGEVASRLAVTTLLQLVLDTPDWIMLAGEAEWKRMIDRIRARYGTVDAVLRAEADADPRLHGMGTTMTVARNVGAELLLAHVGDSRAYLLRGEQLHQLTHDHTLAQELADRDAIRQADVVKHVFRHILTRALGGSVPWAGVDTERIALRDGDQLLLCTDGLTDMVPPGDIATTLRSSESPRAACESLVDAALKNGGKDNVSVALARYQIEPASPDRGPA